MADPGKYEVVISMLRREAENALFSPAINSMLGRFGVSNKALIKMGLDMAENFVKEDPRVKTLIESLVTKDDKTIDATTDILKEDLGTKIDSFSERLKQKLQEKGGV